MPKGVYNHTHVGYRPPVTCSCGRCKLCKHRESRRRYDAKMKKAKVISDEELEKRLIEKFKTNGWDKT